MKKTFLLVAVSALFLFVCFATSAIFMKAFEFSAESTYRMVIAAVSSACVFIVSAICCELSDVEYEN